MALYEYIVEIRFHPQNSAPQLMAYINDFIEWLVIAVHGLAICINNRPRCYLWTKRWEKHFHKDWISHELKGCLPAVMTCKVSISISGSFDNTAGMYHLILQVFEKCLVHIKNVTSSFFLSLLKASHKPDLVLWTKRMYNDVDIFYS